MPHIIVEYAEQLVNEEQITSLLQTVHQAIAESGLFEVSHIKTRAYPFRAFTQAGGSQPYIQNNRCQRAIFSNIRLFDFEPGYTGFRG